MATIINTPGERTDSGSGAGVILGVVLVVIIAVLLLLYGVPALRGVSNSAATPSDTSKTYNVNLGVTAPSGGTGAASGGATAPASGGATQ